MLKDYTITRQTDGAIFEVTKEGDKARIIRVYPYYRTDAAIFNGLILPDIIPPFTSFVHAVNYCKKNLANLA